MATKREQLFHALRQMLRQDQEFVWRAAEQAAEHMAPGPDGTDVRTQFLEELNYQQGRAHDALEQILRAVVQQQLDTYTATTADDAAAMERAPVPLSPRQAQAMNDQATLTQQNDRVSNFSDAAFVRYIQDSQKPIGLRPTDVPPFDEVLEIAAFHQRIVELAASKHTRLKREVRAALLPIPTRQPAITPAMRMEIATYRLGVEDELRDIGRANPDAYADLVKRHKPDLPDPDRAVLVTRMCEPQVKLSRAAAMLTAFKFGVGEDLARRGRFKRKKRRRVSKRATVESGRDLETIQRENERKTRGRARRPRSQDES